MNILGVALGGIVFTMTGLATKFIVVGYKQRKEWAKRRSEYERLIYDAETALYYPSFTKLLIKTEEAE